jgi:hypothetical protein
MAALLKQRPDSKSAGGFQAFLVGLQKKLDEKTGVIGLSLQDLERIARYAHDYSGGGWQARLGKIFGRHLGGRLGREEHGAVVPDFTHKPIAGRSKA